MILDDVILDTALVNLQTVVHMLFEQIAACLLVWHNDTALPFPTFRPISVLLLNKMCPPILVYRLDETPKCSRVLTVSRLGFFSDFELSHQTRVYSPGRSQAYYLSNTIALF